MRVKLQMMKQTALLRCEKKFRKKEKKTALAGFEPTHAVVTAWKTLSLTIRTSGQQHSCGFCVLTVTFLLITR